MKITYYLDEAPSVLTHKPNGMGRVTMKMVDSGALSRKPKSVTITDTVTGESYPFDVSSIRPLSTWAVMECNRMVGIERLRETLPELIYKLKMQFGCTNGLNTGRYIVKEEY
jgi:hypothetical protein